VVSKDGRKVLSQCTDCGKYMPPYKYCPQCQHAHFCSDGCLVRSKLSHDSLCHPRQLPAIDAALQVELHLGGQLGRDVEVYYQHQLRMSLKARGEELIRQLFDFCAGEGKAQLPEDSRLEVLNGHLRIRRSV
jgi:hypothetical protein